MTAGRRVSTSPGVPSLDYNVIVQTQHVNVLIIDLPSGWGHIKFGPITSAKLDTVILVTSAYFDNSFKNSIKYLALNMIHIITLVYTCRMSLTSSCACLPWAVVVQLSIMPVALCHYQCDYIWYICTCFYVHTLHVYMYIFY